MRWPSANAIPLAFNPRSTAIFMRTSPQTISTSRETTYVSLSGSQLREQLPLLRRRLIRVPGHHEQHATGRNPGCSCHGWLDTGGQRQRWIRAAIRGYGTWLTVLDHDRQQCRRGDFLIPGRRRWSWCDPLPAAGSGAVSLQYPCWHSPVLCLCPWGDSGQDLLRWRHPFCPAASLAEEYSDLVAGKWEFGSGHDNPAFVSNDLGCLGLLQCVSEHRWGGRPAMV